jgi:protein gp37
VSAGGFQFNWVDCSWDVLRGCRSMSPGCIRCIACVLLLKQGYPKDHVWRSYVREVLRIRSLRPDTLCLVCSDSDFFLPEARTWWREFRERMAARPDVIFLLLTKRLDLAGEFFERYGGLPNLWLGTSFEDQRTLDLRVPLLYNIPAAGYVLSAQPLIAPVDLTPYLDNPLLRKVVAGCERGEGWRPCDRAWLDQIRDDCAQRGIWYFMTCCRKDDGTVDITPTENDRGSHAPSRPSYRQRRPQETILELGGFHAPGYQEGRTT